MRTPIQLKFRKLADLYAIAQLAPDEMVPEWATRGEFTSVTRTGDELSIVCAIGSVPPELRPSQNWVCLKLQGPFPFSQTGVLLSFIGPLSGNGVPIFTISTYDTDYVLIQEEFWGTASDLLRNAGHEMAA